MSVRTPAELDVKICGVRRSADIDAAIEAGATHAGFVFFERSPRAMTPEGASQLIELHRGRIKFVGLVVDADSSLIEKLPSLQLDAVQLHGDEVPADFRAIGARAGARQVWKAIGVADRADLDAASHAASVADLIVFDARPPKDAARPGGHGRAFDWSVLEAYQGPAPFLLAGGLSADTVEAAVARLRAHEHFVGVDVSSGVEASPGEKDPRRIAQFVAAARAGAVDREIAS